MEESPVRSPFSYEPRLRRLEQWVDSNLSHEVTLEQAADIVCLERHYFCAWFKNWAGLTFIAWLTQKRVDCAATLLRSENLTIDQIARRVGYESPSTLARNFSRLRGEPPSEYRRRVRDHLKGTSEFP